MPLTQTLEPLSEFSLETHRNPSSRKRLPGWTWSISRQTQQHRCISQCLAPVIGLNTKPFANKPFTLPSRVIRILYTQRWQRIRLPLPISCVKSVEFADQDAYRPAIGDDMMLSQQQQVLVFCDPYQASAN